MLPVAYFVPMHNGQFSSLDRSKDLMLSI